MSAQFSQNQYKVNPHTGVGIEFSISELEYGGWMDARAWTWKRKTNHKGTTLRTHRDHTRCAKRERKVLKMTANRH
ncbi:MAG: hypothetical protein OSB62_00915 [Alphaproteobacteria bacterium]|jgi:hypothetical protein|nr:hypothetical protein [Alphaproteobacteria bacterium]